MTNTSKITLFLSLLNLLLLFMGAAVGGKGGMLITLFMVLAMNVSSYWVFRQDRPHNVHHKKIPSDILISNFAPAFVQATPFEFNPNRRT